MSNQEIPKLRYNVCCIISFIPMVLIGWKFPPYFQTDNLLIILILSMIHGVFWAICLWLIIYLAFELNTRIQVLKKIEKDFLRMPFYFVTCAIVFAIIDMEINSDNLMIIMASLSAGATLTLWIANKCYFAKMEKNE